MFEWLKDLLLWVPKKIWEGILSGVAAIMENIPVPAWLDSISSFGSGIPPGVGFFLHVMAVPEGLTIIMAAYALRFLIRRIPVIG